MRCDASVVYIPFTATHLTNNRLITATPEVRADAERQLYAIINTTQLIETGGEHGYGLEWTDDEWT